MEKLNKGIEIGQKIWSAIMALPALLLMYIIGAIRILIHDHYVAVYHNVRFLSGVVASLSELGKEFFVGRKAIALQSDEGLLALVHGTPDGQFEVAGQIIDGIRMSCAFEQYRTYTLLSCYNAAHKDFEVYSTYFVRDYRTLSNHPIIILPFFGRLIIWADSSTTAYMWAVLWPTLVGQILLGFCQGVVAGYRQAQSSKQKINFEDIPEDIRKKLKK